MVKTIPDRALAALLSFEDDKDTKGLEKDALPTLNERVELFLRAKYGEGRIFTASERTEARSRILDTMAENSADEVDAQMRTDSGDRKAEARVWTDDGPQSPIGMEKDVEALVLLIKYCEEEAVRLGLPPAVIECLRIASKELTNSVGTPLMSARVDDHRTH
jgi:hypothetical protein